MARITLAPVLVGGFSLVAAEGEEAGAPVVTVRFAGTADMEATPVLEGYLKRLHAEVPRAGVRVVVFDIAQLDFMNSSSFKCFVTWIGNITKMPADDRYDVRFVSNPQLQWQRRSLEALHRFAPDVVTLETTS
jgi:hypothetical protein